MNHRNFRAMSDRQMMMLLVVAFVGVFATSTCHGAASSQSAPPDKALTLPRLIDGIVIRSENLNYITEQDSEVFAFYRNAPVSKISDDGFLGLLRRPKETQIFRQSWTTFFQLRTQSDPTGRWRQLQEYLEAHLTDRTVLRVSRDSPYDAQYDLYAVGLWNGRTVVGVQMFGVAT